MNKSIMKNLSVLLFSLFLISTLGCFKEHTDLDPIGTPSGGVIEVFVDGFDSTTAQIRVRLFAVDHFGDFYENLRTSDFSVNNSSFENYEYNLTCTDQGFLDESIDYSAMMLFDQSGSIDETDPDDARVTAGIEFTKIMTSKDEGAVAAFARNNDNYLEDLTILSSFTKNKIRLRNQVNALVGKEYGGTPLYQSILELIPLVADEASNQSKAMIVFTDGDDTEGGSISQIISDAVEENIEIYTIGLSLGVNERALTTIAHNTGGAIMFAEDALQLITLYSSLGELLRGSYDYYDICVEVNREYWDWSTGNEITFQLILELIGGEKITFPVFAVL